MFDSTTLKQEMRQTLEENILQFWLDKMIDEEQGGFYGRIDGSNVVHPEAEKGAILNGRLLWSFSAAYRMTRKTEYREAATRAKRYVIDHFIDKEEGGVFWSLNADGTPLDTKKQTYAIGFCIYGLSEYARATGDEEALEWALSLYQDIEEHAFDNRHNGYIEALTRDWKPIADMRLSDKDENGSRTMNTHLHVIEPYTNLYRALIAEERKVKKSKRNDGLCSDKEIESSVFALHASLKNLLDIFTETILNHETYHLDLFFDDAWQGKRNIQSFGHDIEASWLLHETALVLGDQEILAKIEPIVRKIAVAADEGLQPDGSMVYEKWLDTGHVDEQRQWWVMCEQIIGHINLYQYFHDEKALDIALKAWTFVKEKLIDRENGEWFWAVNPDGTTDHEGDKAGFWKCPYHNSRMCLELMERVF